MERGSLCKISESVHSFKLEGSAHVQKSMLHPYKKKSRLSPPPPPWPHQQAKPQHQGMTIAATLRRDWDLPVPSVCIVPVARKLSPPYKSYERKPKTTKANPRPPSLAVRLPLARTRPRDECNSFMCASLPPGRTERIPALPSILVSAREDA